MRISDWSSDVCSSDLPATARDGIDDRQFAVLCRRHARCVVVEQEEQRQLQAGSETVVDDEVVVRAVVVDLTQRAGLDTCRQPLPAEASEIGRAHVCTPVTNAPLVCRPPLETQTSKHKYH